MPRSRSVDGFALAYDCHGAGVPLVLLHGWPGDRGDWRKVAAALRSDREVILPDLRGFGESDKHERDPASAYSAAAQAASVLGLMDELGLREAVIGGYDVGSRIAQRIAANVPHRVRALVITPPVPGAGQRVLSPTAIQEFWYQQFNQLPLIEQLIDGRAEAVRAYLAHIWSHWSGPDFEPAEAELDRLTALYGAPGAFVASVNWYRAGAGMVASSLAERAPAAEDRIAVPTTILWPEQDPVLPRAWGDRIDEFFVSATIENLPGAGHFAPLEAADRFTAALRSAS